MHSRFGFASLAVAILATSSFAQVTFNEVEPNTNKAEATPVVGMTANDVITGTSTGAVVTALSTLITSADNFRVRTTALPLGIYRHSLTITTTGTAGHTGTLRGLFQTAGVISTTSDAAFQASLGTSTPARTNVWYGFGKQEEVYYRVTGTTATTAPYTATLSTSTITPIAIPGAFGAGPITIASAVGQTTDTEIYVYDANLDPVPLGHNDDPASGTGAGPSSLTVVLPAGTYYVAMGTYNTANNQSDANPAEFYDDENVLDFPNVMANTSSVLNTPVSFTVTDGAVTTPVAATRTSIFEIVWGTFTVNTVGGAPTNDNCASAVSIPTGTTVGALGSATHDGTASCDPGGAASKDVWYSFSQGLVGGTLNIDTCGSTGIDTVVSLYNSCGGTEIACNDDCGGTPCGATSSCVSATLLPGQTVWIRVSDKGLGGSLFSLNVSFTPGVPTNDSCTTPVAIAGPGSYLVSNQFATTGTEGQTEAACLAFTFTAVINDVWFTYTPTTNGTVTIATCGASPVSANEDSKIAVYAGAGCPTPGSAIACNDDNGCATFGFESSVSFPATCGTTYLIQFGMYGGSATTAFYFGGVDVSETGGAGCATPVTYFCFGDGTGLACPCANSGAAGNGCANSLNANGGSLVASGNASVSGDTWTIAGSGIPNGPGLYYQAVNQLGGGNGVVFGDGLRCIGGSVIRLGIVTAAGNASSYPSPNPPAVNAIPISAKGFNLAGDVRNYQLWYRDSTIGFCSASVFNLTNAVNVTWTP